MSAPTARQGIDPALVKVVAGLVVFEWLIAVGWALGSGSVRVAVLALASGQVCILVVAALAWRESRRVREQLQRLRVEAHTVTEEVLQRNLQATHDGIMSALGVQRADILDALGGRGNDAAGS